MSLFLNGKWLRRSDLSIAAIKQVSRRSAVVTCQSKGRYCKAAAANHGRSLKKFIYRDYSIKPLLVVR